MFYQLPSPRTPRYHVSHDSLYQIPEEVGDGARIPLVTSPEHAASLSLLGSDRAYN